MYIKDSVNITLLIYAAIYIYIYIYNLKPTYHNALFILLISI